MKCRGGRATNASEASANVPRPAEVTIGDREMGQVRRNLQMCLGVFFAAG